MPWARSARCNESQDCPPNKHRCTHSPDRNPTAPSDSTTPPKLSAPTPNQTNRSSPPNKSTAPELSTHSRSQTPTPNSAPRNIPSSSAPARCHRRQPQSDFPKSPKKAAPDFHSTHLLAGTKSNLPD